MTTHGICAAEGIGGTTARGRHSTKIIVLCGAFACAILGSATRATAAGNPVTNLYVSTGGNDAWTGLLQTPNSQKTDGPKATLEGARAALSTMIQRHQVASGGAVVNVMPGSYALSKTLQLSASDSGATGAPVVYRAWQPGTVEITGAKEIKTWRAVSDSSVSLRFQSAVRKKIVEADLLALGIKDVGARQPIGFYGARVPSVSELFFEGKPMTVAQWPNGAWSRLSTVAPPAGWSFTYSGGNAATWSSENDVWVHGFFHYDWADYYERVNGLNASAHAARTEVTPSYGFWPGARFVFCNVLEELDTPGEYYIDLKRGRVYFYPPAKQSDGRTMFSVLSTPLVRLDKVSHVQFEGLAFRFTRGDALMFNNCDDIAVNGCIVSNVGLHGIETSAVTHTVIRSTDVSNVGYSGIIMSGGDRNALTSGSNAIQNCHIALTGRIVLTSEAAIELLGDGTTVSGCSIHDVPQDAIRIWGNNHTIVQNEIYRACLQSSDAGAVYLGRNFSEQGNLVSGNYFHDILAVVDKNPAPNSGNTYQIKALYLDDFASGTTAFGNVFLRADAAVLIGGGRDNVIQNNAFIDCNIGLSLDARGLTWANGSITDPNSDLMKALKSSAYQSAAYRKAYPNLAGILSDAPAYPKRNVVQCNVAYEGGWLSATKDYPFNYNPLGANSSGVDPGFTDLQGLKLTPKTGSPAAKAGFLPVDGTAAGLKLDTYRTSVPAPGQMPAL